MLLKLVVFDGEGVSYELLVEVLSQSKILRFHKAFEHDYITALNAAIIR